MVRETVAAEQTEALGAELAARLRPGDTVLVFGELGTGKSTLVRGACRALGVEEPVTSPTFALARRYRGRVAVAHLDLYRLETLDAFDAGLIDDYLDAGTIAFIEWPEVAEGMLERVVCRVRIAHAGGDRRHVEIA